MAIVLYPSFLENKRIYNLNQAYWKRLLNEVVKGNPTTTFSPYLNAAGANGTKEYDGNPIFNAYFPDLNKAIRIIQDAPEEGAYELSAWFDEIELEEAAKAVPELVIATTLSRETSAQAHDLMHKWIVDNLSQKEMEACLSPKK